MNTQILEYLREFNHVTVLVRLTLAVLIGGVIGIERERKRRPAGFRTHMITCLGAALTMLTSQYLIVNGYTTDIGRLSAQVVAGIGFIGAGTILVTHNRKVRGLTTAAGFWSSAVIGLAVGAGYYEGAIIASVLILMAELLFENVEKSLTARIRDLTLFVEYTDNSALRELMEQFTAEGIRIGGLEISKRISSRGIPKTAAVFTLHIPRKTDVPSLCETLRQREEVTAVEIM